MALGMIQNQRCTPPGGSTHGNTPAASRICIWTKIWMVRTVGDPASLAPSVKAVVAQVDRDQAVFNVMTMEQRLSPVANRASAST